METAKSYENFPSWIIIITNLISIAIYLIGGYIIYQFGIIWLLIYLLYIIVLEIRLLKKSCVNCCYFGKFCAFGRGKISSLFFKKGGAEKLKNKRVTWKNIIPDFLVSIIPIIAGVVLLILNFNWLMLLLIIILLILTSAGNGFARGSLACKFCQQKEIGCPAQQLFNKNKI